MSGLISSMGDSVKALAAHSRSIETAGRNLANVNNASYARQRVVYGDRGTVQTTLGAQSLGVEAKSIQQLRDVLLDRQVVRETSLKSFYEAEQSAYQKAQAGLGQSIDRAGETQSTGNAGAGNGIAESLTDFFNAFQSLAARPTDPGERQTLMQKAGILTDRIQATDARMNQLQMDLTAQAANDLSDANRILSTIANLNAEIGRFEINSAGGAVDLRDQRQAQVEELTKRIGVETQPHPTAAGQIQVFVRDGSGNPILLVDGTNVTGPLSLSGSVVQGGSTPTTVALNGGSVHGDITARDGAVQAVRTNLDALAHQLVTSVNSAYNPSGATGDFFNAANITAKTISVSNTVTASNLKASDGGPAGANNIAQAVADLAYRNFNPGLNIYISGTFGQHFSTTVSNLGQSLASANLQVSDQTGIESLVRNQRDAISGVSLDEEMTDMMKFQRAFQASSRVIQVINELLENVVNLGRI